MACIIVRPWVSVCGDIAVCQLLIAGLSFDERGIAVGVEAEIPDDGMAVGLYGFSVAGQGAYQRQRSGTGQVGKLMIKAPIAWKRYSGRRDSSVPPENG